MKIKIGNTKLLRSMKMKKNIIRQIIATTMILCIVSGLGATTFIDGSVTRPSPPG